MSVSGGLLAFGLRYVLDGAADSVVEQLEKRLTDHSQALPKALRKANDRAWQAVGLALAGESLFGWVKDVFRDADLKGVRDQIKKFLQVTPTGLDAAPARDRAKAVAEWNALRQSGRLAAVLGPDLGRRVANLDRHGDPVGLTAAAHRTVGDVADELRAEAPHLADLLTAAPADGPPLLAAAFAFFFRRELEDNRELFQGLAYEHLRRISERQDHGLKLLDDRTAGVLDQIDVLFDALGKWFATLGRSVAEIHTHLDRWDETMDRLRAFLDRNDVAPNSSKPTSVSIDSAEELQRLRVIRDALRALPPELLTAADSTQLGRALRAAGLFADAGAADAAASAAARATADRAAEAAAEFNRYKDACETGEWDQATTALRRAVALDRTEYQPFDWNRYELVAVLGAGGFGTVFHCLDRFDVDDDRPAPVAIKTLHHDGLDRTVDAVFREARTLKKLDHPLIIKIRDQDFAHKVDETTRRRPYFVLEYFAGRTLEAYLRDHKTIPAADLLRLAHKVAEAVHAAHRAGVLHRDLKPANILVVRSAVGTWDVRVIDFGLAVKLTSAARASVNIPSDRRASQDRSFAGTLRYAAPEQMGDLPGVAVGMYSDVFAFGKTCIECLFGHTQAQDDEWDELPEPVRAGVRKLLNRCVRFHLEGKNPRFASFELVLAELAALIDAKTPPVVVPGPEVPFAGVVEEKPVEPPLSLPTLTADLSPSEPPKDPKAGTAFTLRVPILEPDVPPGRLTTLAWKPVPARPNPNK